MTKLNLLIVEGNIKKDTLIFTKAVGSSVSENLKKLILKLEPTTLIKIIHPGNVIEVNHATKNLLDFNGVIFTGGAMRMNDQTEEIKQHIKFAKKCFTSHKKILAICWGLQVCVVAAGGKVSKGKNGAHIGIASDVVINEKGKKHPLYKDKINLFNTPAFNFDEVCSIPKNATILSNDKINKVMGLHFFVESSEIWGVQYHPDYFYNQMIALAKIRKDKLINNNYFISNEDFEKNISYIEKEEKKLRFDDRCREVKNWLDYIKK
jgi:GMP synthase (glutamine-hydrolysing)